MVLLFSFEIVVLNVHNKFGNHVIVHVAMMITMTTATDEQMDAGITTTADEDEHDNDDR